MKVAFSVNSFPELSETFILNQIVGLLRRGHEVDIYAARPAPTTSKMHEDVRRLGLLDRTRYRAPMPAAWFPRLAKGALRVARWGWRHPTTALDSLNVFRHGRAALNLTLVHQWFPEAALGQSYDIVHAHYGQNGLRAVAMRNFGVCRGPIITTFHGYDANVLPRQRGSCRMYARLFQQGDLFTVGSEFMRKRILSLGAPAERIVKLPMGVNLARYAFRERRKKGDGQFRLLIIARLVEVKGVEYALRALDLLRSECPGLRCQIAGDGPLRGTLEALANELGVADRVQFLGAVSQEEGLKLYENADAFVLPSVVTASGAEEGQSVVLAEAQASGLPVIATAIGGIPESIRDGESGLLVPPRNPGALASAVSWLVRHPKAWGRMGRAGREHVEHRFDLEKLNDQLVDVYRRAMGFARVVR